MRQVIEVIWAAWRVWRKATSGEEPLVPLVTPEGEEEFGEPASEEESEEESEGESEEASDEVEGEGELTGDDEESPNSEAKTGCSTTRAGRRNMGRILQCSILLGR